MLRARQSGQRPHFAGEICKRRYIYSVRPTVYNNPSTENFSKALFKPKEFEYAGFVRTPHMFNVNLWVPLCGGSLTFL